MKKRLIALFLLVLMIVLIYAGMRFLPTGDDASATESPSDEYIEARQTMVEEGIIGWGIEDQDVIEAMGQVLRHVFVPEKFLDQAYANHPLPIGHGQTISQPFIVALMTQELGVHAGDRVLEIGTGSGYQAAVLAELDLEVFTIEIIAELEETAAKRLEELGYTNVTARRADGYFGWPEEAPFDAIIVTAAPDHVPEPLLDQLKVEGVMVIPVGPVGGYQELWRITRLNEAEYQSVSLGGVRFVPFTREIDGEIRNNYRQTTGP
jgi:protein-L-isoaspartate(D-aspartate) O-methyltransferase